MTLQETAREILADGRGILAADESTGTITKRFEAVGISSTEETRRRYRDLLFTTKDVEQYLGGVILYDETVRQDALDGTGMVETLRRRGIVPGIKVDAGAKDLAGFPGEKVTEGLDGLRERFAEYADLGLRFAKWRSVITVSDTLPTATAIDLNAHGQARYAALAQEAGLVPIVEPGVDHGRRPRHRPVRRGHGGRAGGGRRAAAAPAGRPRGRAREDQHGGVRLRRTRPGRPGRGRRPHARGAAPHDPRRRAGHRVPLGGQDDEQATANLDAIARRGPQPWTVSFSYARALQGRPMSVWAGAEENVAAAQDAFAERLRLTGAANRGEWSPGRAA